MTPTRADGSTVRPDVQGSERRLRRMSIAAALDS